MFAIDTTLRVEPDGLLFIEVMERTLAAYEASRKIAAS